MPQCRFRYTSEITFEAQKAADLNIMLSVLYALLGGLSREMGIERTDSKGCLNRTEAGGLMVYTVILYDAVAGGAGHVRRMVTEEGEAFQQVLQRALAVVDGCSCDPSCYQCLRNYYNQKIHDQLSRQAASKFLHLRLGGMESLEEREEVSDFETEEANEEGSHE